ncbi:hypothetical protein ACEF11_02310 [[Pasteurella] aerogenes]
MKRILLYLGLTISYFFNYAFASSDVSVKEWKLVKQETFDTPFNSDQFNWVKDPLNNSSPWHIDQFDDNGDVWKAISNPTFSENMKKISIYRKSIPFGQDGWLTAELAYVDKHQDIPLALPQVVTTSVLKNENALSLVVPRWDGGAIIRPTKPLPAEYRVEVKLRTINFGGKRNGAIEYDGKYNGYSPSQECKTSYPWEKQGAIAGRKICDYHNVRKENGFYYLTILDHANPAPHGNLGIHYRRKVILDGYYSFQEWSKNSGICNPKTKKLYPLFDSSHNVVNAIFVLGDRFKPSNNYFNNGYLFKTPCGEFEDVNIDGKYITNEDKFDGIISIAELQPELLPEKSYVFVVERHKDRYVIEITGDFKHIGDTTIRGERFFIENNKPIWHYNQTAEEYDGRFNTSLIHKGPTGQYITNDTWKKGSAYPDSFIIGDPHLNFYEGDAIIDDIRLYTK